MSEPSLAAQKAIRARLVGSAEILALVPAASIFDRNARTETTPCIVIGEGQTVDDSSDCIVSAEVYLDLHIWTREAGLASVKRITGACQRALRGLFETVDEYEVDLISQDARFLRDPDGEHAHAVLSVELRAAGDGT